MKKISFCALSTALLIAATSPVPAQSLDTPGIDDVLSEYLGSVPFSMHGHAESAGASPPVVIDVDCNAGGSIGDALLTPGDELVVRISGVCQENVEIGRDDVTLAGSDPSLDGIQGDGEANVVSVRGAANVALENIRVVSPTSGVFVSQSSDGVRIVGCDLPDTAVEVIQSSHVEMKGVSARYLLAELGGRASCVDCNLAGVGVLDDGVVVLVGSVVDDPSPFDFDVVVGASRGTVVAHSTWLNGWVDARGTTLALIDSTVGFGVTLTAGGHLDLRGDVEVLDDPLMVVGFSTVWIEPGSSFAGDIYCAQGGNVSCDDVTIDGSVQGCTSCDPSTGETP